MCLQGRPRSQSSMPPGSGAIAVLQAPKTPSVAQWTPGLGLCAFHPLFAFWPSENASEMTTLALVFLAVNCKCSVEPGELPVSGNTCSTYMWDRTGVSTVLEGRVIWMDLNQVPYPLSGTQLGAHSTVYTTRPCFSQRERTLPHRDRGGTN